MRINLPDGRSLDIPLLQSGIILAIILVIGGASTAFFTIDPEEEGVVLRFGRYERTVDSGLHFKMPFPIENVIKVPTRIVDVQQFGFRTGRSNEQVTRGFESESAMLTGDLNIVLAGWDVQFSRSNPTDFLFNVRDPIATLRDVAQSTMREVMGDRASIPILTVGRGEIQQRARDAIQQTIDQFEMGVQIREVNLIFVSPPQQVLNAFFDLNRAEQDAVRFFEEANKEYQERVPQARGQAERLILEAEGFRQRRINLSRGEAARFLETFNAYRQAPDITRQRLYFEMLERRLPEVREIKVLDASLSGPLPLLNLSGEAPASLPATPARPTSTTSNPR
jgi:membrane protease subunit HflK